MKDIITNENGTVHYSEVQSTQPIFVYKDNKLIGFVMIVNGEYRIVKDQYGSHQGVGIKSLDVLIRSYMGYKFRVENE